MGISKLGSALTKGAGLLAVLLLAGCLTSNDGTRETPQSIVDNLPDEIIPIVIDNEDEIRDIIDNELDDDLQEEANDIIDLIVDVATTTISVSSVTTASGTN